MTTDAELARLQAEASARARADELGATFAPLGMRLPASVQAVLDGSGRVFNPKLWGTDLPNFRAPKFDRKAWLNKAREASKRRKLGDVLRPTMDRAWEILAWWDKDHDGQVQLGMKLWSQMVGCCIETIRKIVRFGEHEDVLNTFNMPKRADGTVKRDKNIYHLVPPDMPPVVIPDDVAPELKPLARAQAWCARWAPYFRMVPRAFGLNTTPLRSRMERNPEPA